MLKSRLTSKGQLTIPKEVRDRLGLRQGDQLIFELEENAIRLSVARRLSVAEAFERLRGSEMSFRGEAAEKAAVADYLEKKQRDGL